MAVIEAAVPSGFNVDLQSTTDLLQNVKSFKKIETKNSNTVVVIYLDNVSTAQICLQITAYRLVQIANGKPCPVNIFDYYDNGKETVNVLKL